MERETLLEKAAEAIKARINDYYFKIDARQNPSNFSRQGAIGFKKAHR